MKRTLVPYRLILLIGFVVISMAVQPLWAEQVDKSSLLRRDGRVQMLKPVQPVIVSGQKGAMTIGPASGQIEVAVREAEGNLGNFTIGEPNGGPILLYGHPNPGTGGTTIRVDGVDSWNHGSYSDIGTVVTGYPQQSGNQSITKWIVGANILLTQILSLVSTAQGGDLDTVEIRYEVENNDATPHDIGLRIMLDTMLGTNDGAPFRVSGVGDITNETEFNGPNMPEYCDIFDDLSSPTIQAKGTLIGGAATRPDRLVFAHWPRLVATPWDFQIDSASAVTLDSAVGIYWNPVTMNPGTKKTYVTYYGLSKMSVVTEGNFTVALSSADALTRGAGNVLGPNPFYITSYIQNSGNGNISDTAATLTLPNGLQLEPGEVQTKTLGTLTPSQQVQVSWLVRATDTVQGGLTFQVDVSGTGVSPVQSSRSILIPSMITISAAEFFIDTDPGEGAGRPLSGTFGSSSVSIQVTGFSIPSLNVGPHTLFIRYRDSLGRWSTPVGQTFTYACNLIVSAAEYFIDQDPGQGMGGALAAADGAFDSPLEVIGPMSIPIAGLSSGAHTLYVRYRVQNGAWSSSVGRSFLYACTGGTITGDIETLAPGYKVGIQGATIVLSGPYQVSTSTVDHTGHFVLTGVSPGIYTVSITAPNHESVSIPGVTVITGETTSIGEKIMGVTSSCIPGDANENGILDMADAIFIMQTTSNLRP